MSNTETLAVMHQLLTAAFSPTQLEVIDESHLHHGHKGAENGGAHFALKISAPTLSTRHLRQSHQAIYQILAELIPQKIHALRIEIM